MYYTNREYVMKAVSSDGLALRHAPIFQTDREIVMKAVPNYGWTLEYAPTFKEEHEYYGRILDLKELKTNMWRKMALVNNLWNTYIILIKLYMIIIKNNAQIIYR